MVQKHNRIPWIDYLKGFITVLVVAHHSSLAYTTFAYFNKAAYNSSTHPIVDIIRWQGLDIFEDFNDIFFMSLMFLIGGIFIIKSLNNKGIILFTRDRFLRLFIPFSIGVTVLMLIAYYPAYYLAHHENNVKAYIIDFFTIESWPSGPPWFIWVLFSFNLIVAILYPYIKQSINRISELSDCYKIKPLTILLIWYGITWVTYVPMVMISEPGTWTGIGPFHFQVSRILLYFSYFIIGAVIGSKGVDTGLFADKSKFILKWPLWLAGCILAYTLLKLSEPVLDKMLAQHQLNRLQARLVYRSIWSLSCTLSSIFFLILFKNLFHRINSLWELLSANAYGIYLVHYIFVLWCQYYLLDFSLPAVVKFLITFIFAVTASWFVTYLFRKNKIIAKYL